MTGLRFFCSLSSWIFDASWIFSSPLPSWFKTDCLLAFWSNFLICLIPCILGLNYTNFHLNWPQPPMSTAGWCFAISETHSAKESASVWFSSNPGCAFVGARLVWLLEVLINFKKFVKFYFIWDKLTSYWRLTLRFPYSRPEESWIHIFCLGLASGQLKKAPFAIDWKIIFEQTLDSWRFCRLFLHLWNHWRAPKCLRSPATSSPTVAPELFVMNDWLINWNLDFHFSKQLGV